MGPFACTREHSPDGGGNPPRGQITAVQGEHPGQDITCPGAEGSSEEGTQPRLRWGAGRGAQRRLASLPLRHAYVICRTNNH